MNETSRKGYISEICVEKHLLEMGFIVSKTTPQAPYDLVVDVGEDLYRLQVKTLRETDNSYRADLRNTGWSSVDSYQYEEYGDSVDAFAIYNVDDDEVYWLWENEAPKHTGRVKDTWRKDAVQEKLSGE